MTAIFADVLESTREPGTSRFSAASVAAILGLPKQDLAELAGVRRNTLRTHPESPRLQSALRELMRVLSAATVAESDPQRAIFCPSQAHEGGTNLIVLQPLYTPRSHNAARPLCAVARLQPCRHRRAPASAR